MRVIDFCQLHVDSVKFTPSLLCSTVLLSILSNAELSLGAHVRWVLPDLVTYYTAAQREACLQFVEPLLENVPRDALPHSRQDMLHTILPRFEWHALQCYQSMPAAKSPPVFPPPQHLITPLMECVPDSQENQETTEDEDHSSCNELDKERDV